MRPISITDKGKNLIAAAVGGESAVNFTRICTFTSVLSEDQDLFEKKIAQSTPVSGITRSGNQCEVYGILDNSEVREGYCIEGLGLYADNGGEEILFGFCGEDSDAFYMPAGKENSRTELTLRIALTADCSENVTLCPNSDSYASAVQLREEIAMLDEVIAQKIDEHNADSNVHSALLSKNNITAAKISALTNRIAAVETVLKSDISTYAEVTFDGLSGIGLNGIWNFELKRIEF